VGARALTPAARAYRLPAEWEPHEATWIGWPHNRTDWPGKFGPIPWVYGEMVRRLAPGEIVRVLVGGKKEELDAKRVVARAGCGGAPVEFFRMPTNRGWTRDSGPAFVRGEGRRAGTAIRRFRFNGWTRYDDWRKDDAIPPRVARALGLRLLPARSRGRDIVLEGGAIDVNGSGSLLTTEECLLDPHVQVRNPGMSRRDYEKAFGDLLGAGNVLWLNRGIAGDDTHGHVDDIARFTGPRTVVLCREENRSDENYAALEENRERLEGLRLEDGSRVEVAFLPMPSPLFFDGRRLPASYANFYVGNAAVLVPTFNDPRDRIALGILGELFTDRPVVGIHAVDLVWGLGTIHCLTRQQPA
jgi:agmatine deiminase